MGVTLGVTSFRPILVGDKMEVNQTKQKQDQKTMTDRGLTAEPQAGALKGEIERTELGEEENPFLRRSKVAHTPPKREGSLDRPRKDLRIRHGSLDLSFAAQDAEVDDSITLERRAKKRQRKAVKKAGTKIFRRKGKMIHQTTSKRMKQISNQARQ
jgi:hypothetical protein